MRWVKWVVAVVLVVVVAAMAVFDGEPEVANGMSPRVRDYRVCGLGLLMGAVGHGTYILQSDQVVPDNADVVGEWIDANGCVVVEIYDSSFDLVPEGATPPLVSWEWHGYAPGTGPWNRIVTAQEHYGNWRGPIGSYPTPAPAPTVPVKVLPKGVLK